MGCVGALERSENGIAFENAQQGEYAMDAAHHKESPNERDVACGGEASRRRACTQK